MTERSSVIVEAEGRRRRRAAVAVGVVYLASNLTFMSWAALRGEWPVAAVLTGVAVINVAMLVAAQRGHTRLAGYAYATSALAAVVLTPMVRGNPGYAAFFMVVGLMLGAVILPARDVFVLYLLGFLGELVVLATPVTRPELTPLGGPYAEGSLLYLVVGLIAVAMAASLRQLVDDLRRRDDEAREATRRAEALARQLEHSQRMEALGRLAGGIAHDFNNLLTVMQSCSSLLGSQLEAKAQANRDLADLDDAIARASSLTKQLLAFARRDVVPVEAVELRSFLTRISDLLRRLLGSGVAFELQLPEADCHVMASASQLEQVLMNLAVNARDAMTGQGRLIITLAHEEGHPQCVLTVRDTGPGFSAETKARIFEPFFTTKGHGTGLGLSTVYGVVTRLDGQISAESQPGEGATFRVVLPVVAPPAREAPAHTGQASTGRVSVLVVDDEPVLREQVVRLLVGAGHRARAHGSAAEALADGADADVLLTDLQLGDGLSGVQLVEQLWARRPSLRVVLMSGFTADPAATAPLLARGAVYVAKPFTADVLLRAVTGAGEGRVEPVVSP
jgi:signal transduction histidine kinase/ActR/RegA family two-component response regulator